MKCASAQVASCWEQPEKTLKKIEPCIRSAASLGAAIIAFPEQFATGWNPRSHLHIEDRSGTIVSGLKTLSQEYSIAVLGSYRERHQPLPHNTAFVVGADGSLRAWYAKMHLFSPAHEDQCYAAGNDIAVFLVDGMKFGIAICYDLRFPSLFQLYAGTGVHGVFVPSAWPASRVRHYALFIMARAVENQMYVIGINTVGKTPVDIYSGASITADPEGEIVARAGDGEEIIISDINPAKIDAARRKLPVRNDLRTELYHQLLRKK
jgi:omega-amidase